MHKLPVNKKKYKKYSLKVREVMREYDEKFEPVGLDEGYVDLTPLIRKEINKHKGKTEEELNQIIHDKGKEIMKNIQKDVFEKTEGLTLSLGMAPTRFLSKLCSEVEKPNGSFILRRDKKKILELLDSFSLGRIKYIGPHNERIISGMGSFAF